MAVDKKKTTNKDSDILHKPKGGRESKEKN